MTEMTGGLAPGATTDDKGKGAKAETSVEGGAPPSDALEKFAKQMMRDLMALYPKNAAPEDRKAYTQQVKDTVREASKAYAEDPAAANEIFERSKVAFASQAQIDGAVHGAIGGMTDAPESILGKAGRAIGGANATQLEMIAGAVSMVPGANRFAPVMRKVADLERMAAAFGCSGQAVGAVEAGLNGADRFLREKVGVNLTPDSVKQFATSSKLAKAAQSQGARAIGAVTPGAIRAAQVAFNQAGVQRVAGAAGISPDKIQGALKGLGDRAAAMAGTATNGNGPVRPISRDEAGIDQSVRQKT